VSPGALWCASATGRAGAAAAVVFGLLSAVAAPQLQAQIRGVVVEDARPGRPAPNLILPYVTAAGVGAEPYELRLELGRVVVLAFCPQLGGGGCLDLWRTWGRAESPFGDDVSLVGISGDSASVALAVVGREGWGGRFLTDLRGREGRRWGVPPGDGVAVFVVGPEGRVAYRDLQFRLLDSGSQAALQGGIQAARRSSGGGDRVP